MCNIVMMTTGTVKQQAYATLTLLSMNMWGCGGREVTQCLATLPQHRFLFVHDTGVTSQRYIGKP